MEGNFFMKHIVIMGGGFVGSTVAQSLESTCTVTLIDSKNYFEFTPGILRTLVEPEHRKNIQVLHASYLKKTRIMKGEVTRVTPHAVFVNKKKISFDYLVIATGSSYTTPIKAQNIVLSTRVEILRKYYAKLEQSKSVLIIGGGLVGVELAAEILCAYPEKQVTIAHAKPTLLERMPLPARMYAQTWLQKRGAVLFLDERVVSSRKKSFVTNTGRIIAADLAFQCTGIVPNTVFMKKEFQDLLNEKNQVCVTNTLQLEGFTHIFAGGDVTNIPEEKTAQNAAYHAQIISKNIIALEQHQQLTSYVPASRIMILSLGKYAGILSYGEFVLKGIIPGILKQIVEWVEMRKKKTTC